MSKVIEIQTRRLRLRQWRNSDWPLFAALNADSEVMAFYPHPLEASESNALAEKFTALIAMKGWGFWAVERIEDGEYIGFVGLNEPSYELPVSPCVEIGWRLAKPYWGHGYATEAGVASLFVAFERLALTEIFSFTSVGNRNSRAVMQRLNMVNTHHNFSHPMIPDNHPLQEHVLYRIDKQGWLSTRSDSINYLSLV